MKNLTIMFTCAALSLVCLGAQAHGYQRNGFGASGLYIGFSNGFFLPSYNSFYSPYPGNNLIGGIQYRNRNTWNRLQNRHFNGRFSDNRNYRRAYRQGYRNGFRDGSSNVYRPSGRTYRYRPRSEGYIRYESACVQGYYDQLGNYAERSLPNSACRY